MIGEDLSDHIQFDFLYDNHFSDLKANELLQEQLGVVASMEPYMGKYFFCSIMFVLKFLSKLKMILRI